MEALIDTLEITLELPAEEEKHREWYEDAVRDAHKRISGFANYYQWQECVSTPLIQKVHVCGTKEDFNREVIRTFDLASGSTIPSTYSAFVSDELLVAVRPEEYRENVPYGRENDAYEKLLTHELAHALHIRILDGKEEQMGPRWFYEGFAILAADQFKQMDKDIEKQDMQNIVDTDQSVPYVYYRFIMNELLAQMDLREAVDSAKQPGFRFSVSV